jgi:hypothetical protein
MTEALLSHEASVLTRATRRNITEDGILHSHRRENLKYYSGILFCHLSTHHRSKPVNQDKKSNRKNPVALSPQANHTTRRPPLVDEI